MPSRLAYRLSRTQCEYLLHHVDGIKWPVSKMYNIENPNEQRTRNTLIALRLIRYVDDNRATVYTEKGQQILREVCELWIEYLTSAGYRIAPSNAEKFSPDQFRMSRRMVFHE
jgi:hypothetical protein